MTTSHTNHLISLKFYQHKQGHMYLKLARTQDVSSETDIMITSSPTSI
jgi:hypothetical protein